jgi:crossover junction endodeoxyribonuclease RuvC
LEGEEEVKNYIGIDPGKSGGIAVLTGSSVETQYLSATEADVWSFLYGLSTWPDREDSYAYIEKVHSMPRQGVASTFKFGQSYGFLRGILVAIRIPFEEVTPQAWQKAMGCMSRGDKNVTKAKAQQLFPKVTVTHAIADALLIAEFCRRTRG